MKGVPQKLGDYTGLSKTYSKFRPGYSETILTSLLSMLNKPVQNIDFVDVGAGTGIWTRMMANRGCKSVVAIEPNDEMRQCGEKDSEGFSIVWRKGSGEQTGLENGSCDLLTMASSFHWVDFEKGVREFHRVLRKEGRFAALWNPRCVEMNPLLVAVESELYKIAPNIKRVSSGRSGLTEELTQRLYECPLFEDVVFLEGRHTVNQTPEQYVGIWKSVNDIQVQAGSEKFDKFIDFVRSETQGIDNIEVTYLTRVWSARTI